MELKKEYEIIPFGGQAMLVNFTQKIDEHINAQAVGLADKICEAKIKGVEYAQPAYCSVAIGYDAGKISFGFLKDIVLMLLGEQKNNMPEKEKKSWHIPVCYEREYALDIIEVSSQIGLTPDEIIKLHTSTPYHIYMIGFLPGFPYLGKLPNELNCRRKESPRIKVPAQSVGLAGMQTGVYPVTAPGGWQIIGRTPIKIFDTKKANPFLFKAGEKVKFHAVSKKEYGEIKTKIEAASFDYTSLYG